MSKKIFPNATQNPNILKEKFIIIIIKYKIILLFFNDFIFKFGRSIGSIGLLRGGVN
jgi:hypothetical protein